MKEIRINSKKKNRKKKEFDNKQDLPQFLIKG